MAAFIVGVSTIPRVGYVVGTGLDPSWGLGLHMAHAQNLVFGRDILWTFGPLGFLVAPTMAYPLTGLAAYWIRIPVFVGITHVVQRCLRSAMGARRASVGRVSVVRVAVRTAAVLLASVPISWVLIGALGSGGNIIVAVYVFAVAFAIRALLTRQTLRLRSLVGLSVFCGIALLVRFDTGLVGFGLVALLSAQICRGWGERVRWWGAIVLAFVVAVLGGWVAAGQPLSAFPRYIVSSFELGRGYGGGMAWSAHPSWVAAAVAACGVATLVCLARSGYLGWRRPTVWALVGVAGIVVTNLQQSFSRFDNGHVMRTVCLCSALLIAFISRRNIFITSLSLCLLVMVGLSLNDIGQPFPHFGFPKGPVAFVHPSNGWTYLGHAIGFTTSRSSRDQRIAREHQRLGDELAVPEAVRAAVRGKSVHIEGIETSLAWVYGWKWRPVPVFQTYQANTPWLDQADADAYAGSSALPPEAVVSRSSAIDARVPRWTSPRAMLAMLCHYQPAASANGWTAWTRRGTSGCGPALPGRPVRADDNAVIAALTKAASTGDSRILVAHFFAKQSLGSSARALPIPLTITRVLSIASASSPASSSAVAGTLKPHEMFITAMLADGPNIVSLPKCLRDEIAATSATPLPDVADDGTATGMDTYDLIPSALAAHFTGIRIDSIPYRC